MTKTRNFPLAFGLLMTLVFIAVAWFGPSWAPYDPLTRFTDVIFVEGEAIIPMITPVQPFTLGQFRLGTDTAGRDVYSRLLYAIRPTLLLCFWIVLIRTLIGIPLGLLAGWFHGGRGERILNALFNAAIAFPLLIFCLAAISFMGRSPLDFMIALSLTGWVNMALFVKNRTQVTLEMPYIEGALALGAGPWRILRSHVLPQMWPALPALLAFELSAVILLLSELGFLGMFIGGGVVIEGADPNSAGTIAVGLTAGFPELSQMLSDFWAKIIRTPWEIVIAGGVVFLAVFSFSMLGEGLRKMMDVTQPHGRSLPQIVRDWLGRDKPSIELPPIKTN